jgi:hypothetical protein
MAVIPELLRYVKISFFHPQPKLKRKEKSGVYVSLTTTPSRISKLRDTLISLSDQSVLPEEIIINIPKISKGGIRYEIPDFINHMKLVHINFIEEDLGPASKSLPTLKIPSIPSDALIIVLDDDQVYPKKLIENYLHHARTLPNHALTLCGWRVPKSLEHSDKKILRGAGLKIVKPKPNISGNTSVEIIQGASSYAIRKSFFTNEVFDYVHAPKGAFFADDIWLSGHLAKKKIPRTLVMGNFAYCRMESYKHLKTKGLRDTANADNSNNDALYRYFEGDWKLFD